MVCIKKYLFVQYSSQKCYKNFVQSVFDARRDRDEILFLRKTLCHDKNLKM